MRIVIALVLMIAGWAICRAQDTGYRVRVVLVSGNEHRLEAKFATIPDDLRLICQGDPRGMYVGDFVKLEVKGDKWVVGKMECGQMALVH